METDKNGWGGRRERVAHISGARVCAPQPLPHAKRADFCVGIRAGDVAAGHRPALRSPSGKFELIREIRVKKNLDSSVVDSLPRIKNAPANLPARDVRNIMKRFAQ
jgi:hypothetical protein